MKLNWIGYHALSEKNIVKYVPVKEGVYKIGEKSGDGYWPIYVGQTTDLNDRMNQYYREETDNSCLKGKLKAGNCGFKVAEVTYADDRDAAERALYDKYEPDCNDPDKIPDVPAADINCD